MIVFTFAGIWAADKLETYWGEDPSRVVVDEMVGVWIPLLAVPNDDKWFWYVIAAFALFRIFDIATVDDMSQNVVTGVKLEDGTTMQADAVIVATGGFSYQTTGSTGDG